MLSTTKLLDSKDHSASTSSWPHIPIPKITELLTLPTLLFNGTFFATPTTKEDKQRASESLDSLLTCYEHNFRSNISQLLNVIPTEQFWRFFIDGNAQYKGIFAFENEPGYLLAMAKAFNYSFQPIKDLESFIKQLHYIATKEVKGMLFDDEKPTHIVDFQNISTDILLSSPCNNHEINALLKKIKNDDTLSLKINVSDDPKGKMTTPHTINSSNIGKSTKRFLKKLLSYRYAKVCLVQKVPILSTDNDDPVAKQKLNYRNENNSVLILGTVDDNEISELHKEIKSNTELSLYITISSFFDSDVEHVVIINADNVAEYTTQSIINLLKRPTAKAKLRFLHDEEVEKRMQNRIHDYQVDILRANSKLDKLKVIVKFIKDLEFLHPFSDGNTRTFLMLRNRLLIDEGFPPVVALDPNKAYGHPVETLLNDTLLAMQNTLNLTKGKEPFSPSTKKLLKNLPPWRKKYFHEVTNVINALKEQLALEELTHEKETRARCGPR